MPSVNTHPETGPEIGRPEPIGSPIDPDGDVVTVPGEEGRAVLKRRLHEELLAVLASGRGERLQEREMRPTLLRLAERLAGQQGSPLEGSEQETLVDQVLDEVFGYGPLETLVRDHDISDILINGPRQVFVERLGQLRPTEVTFRDEDHLMQIVRRMLVGSGRPFEDNVTLVDVRLPDGSRLNFVRKPPAVNGPLVSIRRFGARPLTAEDLLNNESLTPEMLEFLAACVKARINTIVSGGTGSGKTTLLNALSRYIPDTERIVTIEDTAELELQQRHLAKMEAVAARQDSEGASMRELLRNSLRMRPDRIIVGECRGAEALEMLQAMNTGHEGSLTTIHGNSTREALARIELMIGLAGIEIPTLAVRKLIASSINLVIQVSRLPGGKRKVMTVAEITGMEGDVFSMQELFEFVQTGVDSEQCVAGYFRATGIRPRCLSTLKARGSAVPVELFAERVLRTRKARESGP